MPLSDVNFQPRGERRHPAGVVTVISSALSQAGTQLEETLNRIDGLVRLIIIQAGDLATDTTFNFDILNEDGVAVFSKTGISDNGTVKYVLSEGGADPPFPIVTAGRPWKIRWSWATSQTLAAGFFSAKIYYIT